MTIKHLVLPGGGPTGIQLLGALQQLHKCGFWKVEDIKTIYATSAGAIISLLIALKFDWESITDYFILRPWHETYSINISQIFESYSKKGIFDNSAIELFYKPFFETKDLSISMTMKEFYEYSGIELHFFSLELNSFEIVDVSYKTFPDIPVIQSVHMSCALPMIISPVCFDGKCFVDGGVLSNYPINFCIENEKNVNEILGIKNIYDTAENTIINNESTILDYSIYFITKLLNNVGSRLKYTGDLPYELKNNALLMSVNRVKESLYSSDVRREMIEEGVISANTFLAELAEREENIKDVDVDVDVDAIVDAIVEEKKDEENNEK